MKKVFFTLILFVLLFFVFNILYGNKINIFPYNSDSSQQKKEMQEKENNVSSSDTYRKNIIELVKEILFTLRSKDKIEELPKSLSEVKLTPEVRDVLEYFPGGYEKYDYDLKLLDRVSKCLGDKAPYNGAVYIMIKFEFDPTTKIATGGGEPPADIRMDNLQDDFEREVVTRCFDESHVGYSFDAEEMTKMEGFDMEQTKFVRPLEIKFPLKESNIYKLMKDGYAGIKNNNGGVK